MKKLLFILIVAGLSLSCSNSNKFGLAKGKQQPQTREYESTDEAWYRKTSQILANNREKRKLEVEERKLQRKLEVQYEKLPPKKRNRQLIVAKPFDFH